MERLSCREGPLPGLLAELAGHRLDVVLADAPAAASGEIRVFSRVLRESPVAFLASPALTTRLSPGFPESLHDAPALLPSPGTTLRRDLDDWFNSVDVRPRVVAEIDSSAMIKALGQEGLGFFAVPAWLADAIAPQYDVQCLGEASDLISRIYALHAERRVDHPAVKALLAPRRRPARR